MMSFFLCVVLSSHESVIHGKNFKLSIFHKLCMWDLSNLMQGNKQPPLTFHFHTELVTLAQ